MARVNAEMDLLNHIKEVIKLIFKQFFLEYENSLDKSVLF